MEMQLAGLHLERGDPKLATPIYQQLLTDDPNRVDAWAGLISSLHAVGNDKEAAAQAQRIPAAARAQLESHMNYLQTMGSVYQALGQSQQALVLLNRVQQYYAAHTPLRGSRSTSRMRGCSTTARTNRASIAS